MDHSNDDRPLAIMEREIRAMDDATLAKELAFAEGFALPDPDAVTWLYALRVEMKARTE